MFVYHHYRHLSWTASTAGYGPKDYPQKPVQCCLIQRLPMTFTRLLDYLVDPRSVIQYVICKYILLILSKQRTNYLDATKYFRRHSIQHASLNITNSNAPISHIANQFGALGIPIGNIYWPVYVHIIIIRQISNYGWY